MKGPFLNTHPRGAPHRTSSTNPSDHEQTVRQLSMLAPRSSIQVSSQVSTKELLPLGDMVSVIALMRSLHWGTHDTIARVSKNRIFVHRLL